MTGPTKKEEIQTTEGSDSVLISIIGKIILTVVLSGGLLKIAGIF